MTATEPVSQPDTRLDDFRRLLDEASEAFESGKGGTVRRFLSALSVFRGRWGVVFGGIAAWASQQTSVGAGGKADDVDQVVDQALRAEALAEEPPPARTAAEPEPEEPSEPAATEPEPEPHPAAAAVEDDRGRREKDEQLVKDVRARRERRERELAADARRLRFLELFVIVLLLLAAVLALAIATIAAVTILANPAAGAVVAAAALVPGGGTAILFRFWRGVTERRHEIDAQRERNNESLESVEARLSVGSEAERDRLIAEYAATLRSN